MSAKLWPQGFWGLAYFRYILVTLRVYGTLPGRALHVCWALGLIGLLRVRPKVPCCSESASHFSPAISKRILTILLQEDFSHTLTRGFFPYFRKPFFPYLSPYIFPHTQARTGTFLYYLRLFQEKLHAILRIIIKNDGKNENTNEYIWKLMTILTFRVHLNLKSVFIFYLIQQ